MSAKEIIGKTRLDDAELEATVAYFSKAVGGSITPALYNMLRDVVRQRENELFGAPKFEAGQYGSSTPQSNDSNEQGEP